MAPYALCTARRRQACPRAASDISLRDRARHTTSAVGPTPPGSKVALPTAQSVLGCSEVASADAACRGAARPQQNYQRQQTRRGCAGTEPAQSCVASAAAPSTGPAKQHGKPSSAAASPPAQRPRVSPPGARRMSATGPLARSYLLLSAPAASAACIATQRAPLGGFPSRFPARLTLVVPALGCAPPDPFHTALDGREGCLKQCTHSLLPAAHKSPGAIFLSKRAESREKAWKLLPLGSRLANKPAADLAGLMEAPDCFRLQIRLQPVQHRLPEKTYTVSCARPAILQWRLVQRLPCLHRGATTRTDHITCHFFCIY